jgi:ABC-type branched-subunit amino acid transport system ATPase component
MPLSELERRVTGPSRSIADDILVISGLSMSFGGLKAVDDVSFGVPRGGVRALIGPNGAGKSTIVNMLSGASRPSSGSIRLDGTELSGRPANQVARQGMVRTFQNGRLFPRLTVLENVLTGADGRFDASLQAVILRTPSFRAEEARQRARAHDLLHMLGMAQDGTREVGSLPYGKQRKIEIARALISDPKVMLLDEPAAGLNSGEVEGLIALVDELRGRGLSILLIEHNMGLVMRLADSITVINFGQKIAEGPPAAIRTDERVIEAYLGRRRAYARV